MTHSPPSYIANFTSSLITWSPTMTSSSSNRSSPIVTTIVHLIVVVNSFITSITKLLYSLFLYSLYSISNMLHQSIYATFCSYSLVPGNFSACVLVLFRNGKLDVTWCSRMSLDVILSQRKATQTYTPCFIHYLIISGSCFPSSNKNNSNNMKWNQRTLPSGLATALPNHTHSRMKPTRLYKNSGINERSRTVGAYHRAVPLWCWTFPGEPQLNNLPIRV